MAVFALRAGGGDRAGSTASESGYFAVRSVLAKTVVEVARFVAERGVIKEGADLAEFVAQVAARFGLATTQKVAAKALPVVGALGGAAVNYACMEDVARRHFTVRRLDRIYGKDRTRAEYDLLAGTRNAGERAPGTDQPRRRFSADIFPDRPDTSSKLIRAPPARLV